MSNTPTAEPTVHTAGDTLRFTRALPDYLPADGWSLSYALVNGGTQITLTSTDNGDGTHLVKEAAADTVAWSAGHYRWQAFVSKGPDRFTVGRGMLEIRANFATADSGLDARGTWQTILDNLEAAYAQMSAGEIKTASVTVGGNRVVQYRSIEELIKAINNARQQAAMEQGATATSGALGVTIKARF